MIGLSRITELRSAPGLRITDTASAQKRCYCVVLNADGTFNREVTLTTAQYHALATKGAGVPPGVTADEWHNGRTFAYGIDHDLGDVQVTSGEASILVQSAAVNGRTTHTLMRFRSGEWSGTPPNITVSMGVLATLPGAGRPLSIHDGIVVL